MGRFNLVRIVRTVFLAGLLTSFAGCAITRSEPSPSQPHGEIEVGFAPATLFPVVIQGIDGKPQSGATGIPRFASLAVVRNSFVPDGRQHFRLTPGEHTIDLTALVRQSDATLFLPVVGPAKKGTGKLTFSVEDGKRYKIAARVPAARPADWEPVVYEVSEISGRG